MAPVLPRTFTEPPPPPLPFPFCGFSQCSSRRPPTLLPLASPPDLQVLREPQAGESTSGIKQGHVRGRAGACQGASRGAQRAHVAGNQQGGALHRKMPDPEGSIIKEPIHVTFHNSMLASTWAGHANTGAVRPG